MWSSEAIRRLWPTTQALFLLVVACGQATRRAGDGDLEADGDSDTDSDSDVDSADASPPDAIDPMDDGDIEPAWECPPEMTLVRGHTFGGSYCVDRWEARIDEEGRAVSEEGTLPASPVTWAEARDACQLAGKTLCAVPVWHDACTTETWNAYPYEGSYQPGTCNDREGPAGAVWPTGSGHFCVGRRGTVDMVGNVSEWTDDCRGSGAERTCLRCGGSFLDPPHLATCLECRAEDPDETVEGSGFRCCASPSMP